MVSTRVTQLKIDGETLGSAASQAGLDCQCVNASVGTSENSRLHAADLTTPLKVLQRSGWFFIQFYICTGDQPDSGFFFIIFFFLPNLAIEIFLGTWLHKIFSSAVNLFLMASKC